MNSYFSRASRPPIFRLAAVVLSALAMCGLTSCGRKHYPVTRAEIGEIDNAAKNGDLEKVKALLKYNPDLVNSKNQYGDTPLHWAAGEGHKDIVALLLADKADVNATGIYGYTPLHWAAQLGYTDVAELLLAHGANVNARDGNRDTPLFEAAEYGNTDVAELLLAHGAEVNVTNVEGFTPLRLATMHGTNSQDIAELLRQHGGQE